MTCLNYISILTEDDIILWHFRLEHPNFHNLRRFFPKLFINKYPSLFKYEICELTKHHHTHFHVQPYKVTKPFTRIYSDVWGTHELKQHLGENDS